MDHKVGSKVVCVDGDFTTHIENDPDFFQTFHGIPKEGKTYKVRTSECGAVRLDEIVNPVGPINLGEPIGVIWDEPAFEGVRFAPLLDNRDDLTNEMLKGIGLTTPMEEEFLVPSYEPEN